MANLPKLITLYLAVKLTQEKNITIGKEFGGISGNAGTHAYRKVKEMLLWDNLMAKLVSDIEKNIDSEFRT